MAQKRKRRLNKEEILQIRRWFDSAPGRKPTVRQIAKAFGVNQPSIIKSLGGWKGIERGKPVPPPQPITPLERNLPSPQLDRGTFEDGKIKQIK